MGITAALLAILATDFTVRGKAIDPLGASISSASVTLKSKDSPTLTSPVDTLGAFELKVPRPGFYTLYVRAIGFATLRRKLLVGPENPTFVLGNLALSILDCDAPGVHCFEVTPSPPSQPDSTSRPTLKGILPIQANCIFDLDKSSSTCHEPAATADLRIVRNSEGRLRIKTLAGAKLGLFQGRDCAAVRFNLTVVDPEADEAFPKLCAQSRSKRVARILFADDTSLQYATRVE